MNGEKLIRASDARKAVLKVDPKSAYCIDSIPAVDAVEVVHGRWAWDTEDIYKCSNCGEKSHVKEVMGQPDWGYCPNCGAKMDLEV
jgi:DNA-directed RNA polymerase subunit RPC12/RpoP